MLCLQISGFPTYCYPLMVDSVIMHLDATERPNPALFVLLHHLISAAAGLDLVATRNPSRCMSGAEYCDFVVALIAGPEIKWNSFISLNLISMFKELRYGNETLKLVLNKAASIMTSKKTITVDELP